MAPPTMAVVTNFHKLLPLTLAILAYHLPHVHPLEEIFNLEIAEVSCHEDATAVL
jgi:hypothetical protein